MNSKQALLLIGCIVLALQISAVVDRWVMYGTIKALEANRKEG